MKNLQASNSNSDFNIAKWLSPIKVDSFLKYRMFFWWWLNRPILINYSILEELNREGQEYVLICQEKQFMYLWQSIEARWSFLSKANNKRQLIILTQITDEWKMISELLGFDLRNSNDWQEKIPKEKATQQWILIPETQQSEDSDSVETIMGKSNCKFYLPISFSSLDFEISDWQKWPSKFSKNVMIVGNPLTEESFQQNKDKIEIFKIEMEELERLAISLIKKSE